MLAGEDRLALAQTSLEDFHLGIQLYLLQRRGYPVTSLFELDPITGIVHMMVFSADPLSLEDDAPANVE